MDDDGLAIRSATRIGSGYMHRFDSAALVIGPTGLAYDARNDTVYVASTGDNEIFAIGQARNRSTNGGPQRRSNHCERRCGERWRHPKCAGGIHEERRFRRTVSARFRRTQRRLRTWDRHPGRPSSVCGGRRCHQCSRLLDHPVSPKARPAGQRTACQMALFMDLQSPEKPAGSNSTPVLTPPSAIEVLNSTAFPDRCHGHSIGLRLAVWARTRFIGNPPHEYHGRTNRPSVQGALSNQS